jgi:shikimate dehydrogenase
MIQESKVLGLLGNATAHSLSPLMHNTAARLLGIDCVYGIFDVATTDDLPAAIEGIRALGIAGANVTIPYKERVVKYLDSLSAEASEVQAVNTILNQDGSLIGFNTDIHGFAEPIRSFKPDLEKEDVAILGSGGAARAVIQALRTEFKPSAIWIAARNEMKAKSLKDDFKRRNRSLKIKVANISDAETIQKIRDCKLIVNATPVGSLQQPASKEDLISIDKFWTKDHIAYDLVYKPLITPFLAKAKAEGATIISGLDMLIQQGAKSFELWTGKSMPIEPVRAVLLQALASSAQAD